MYYAPDGFKYCPRCEVLLPVDDFHRSSKHSKARDGYYHYCKVCRRLKDVQDRATRRAAYDNGDDEPSPAVRLTQVRKSAKARGLKVYLSVEDVRRITFAKPCSYCAGKLPYYGAGIDRVDSSQPYQLVNPDGSIQCRPCCSMCNRVKSAHITAKEFETMINARIKAGWIGWPARYEQWEKK